MRSNEMPKGVWMMLNGKGAGRAITFVEQHAILPVRVQQEERTAKVEYYQSVYARTHARTHAFISTNSAVCSAISPATRIFLHFLVICRTLHLRLRLSPLANIQY
eukprot:GHVU01025667.1.p1 GENE.GHVU01025667.1~~GHVU01025667.1.p1  ORF type:complete len:105 (+),score=3.20 GHVU01025667.1:17-331(+)